MENSPKSNSNKNSDSHQKSPNSNNTQTIKSFPQLSIISSSKRKTYNGPEHPSKRWGHSAVLYNNSMIIFGGRHSQRILSNIYSLDFATLSWTKIDPYSKAPQARDSHSAVIYNNSDMIIFGGNGVSGKMNDLWNFNFNLKKWTEISKNDKGIWPKPRDGHNTAVIYNKYMVVYAGLDDKDNVIQEIFLYEIEKKLWYQCAIEGQPIQNKDGQSCCKIGDTLYLFGGQGPQDDEYSNDLFTVKFEIGDDLVSSKPKAIINKVEVNKNNLKPTVRASQTCVGYKNQFLIIIGGESKTQEPLNDIWIFDIKAKLYSEIKLENNEKIEGRFCHTCLVNGDFIAIYGGMQNSETTLDILTILGVESKNNKKNISSNVKGIKNKKVEISSNNKKKRIENNNDTENKNDSALNASGDNNDIFSDNNINNVDMEDFCADTNDLININFYSFEEIKKNYLNNLITWKFLKSLSDFYKWPLGCIGNFIINSSKPDLNTKNIHIDIKKFRNDEIYLSIKDDGKGMTCSEFNGVLFSFVKNQNKDINYFQYGFSMKTSGLRLANSFLIISKTVKEVSIGMISSELQKKLSDDKINCDYILTPIVNYKIEQNELKNNYIPKSNYPLESLNLILDEINFLFKDKESLIKYFDTFQTGTHIFLFDLKTKNKNEIGFLKTMKENSNVSGKIESNYELLFDEDEADISLNNDNLDIPENLKKNLIDFSLKKYLKFLFLKPDTKINIYLFGKKLQRDNPYYNIKLLSNDGDNLVKITNLNYISDKENLKTIDCFDIEGSEYNGILFNEKFLDSINNTTNIAMDEIKEKDYLNGVLFYKDNILISRMNQSFLGDINFFVKKLMKINDDNEIENKIYKNIFKRNGYIQLPDNCYEVQFNKLEIKDQALFGFIYYKLKMLLQKIQKN